MTSGQGGSPATRAAARSRAARRPDGTPAAGYGPPPGSPTARRAGGQWPAYAPAAPAAAAGLRRPGADRASAHGPGRPRGVHRRRWCSASSRLVVTVARTSTSSCDDTLARLKPRARAPTAEAARHTAADRRLRWASSSACSLFAAYAMFVWFAWRGRNWARIVLWVLGGLGLLGSADLAGRARFAGAASSPASASSRACSSSRRSWLWRSSRRTSGSGTSAGCGPRVSG